MKKIAVIAGGGALGSYTVGKLLRAEHDYDVVIGTSTGAMMAPLVALGEYEKLSEIYLATRAHHLFEKNPFKENGNLRIFSAIKSIITKKLSLGSNNNQLELIKNTFTKKDFNKLRKLGKEVIVVVKNISCYNVPTEYISSNDYDYDTFCHFIWASASVPLVTSVITINDTTYTDGGVTESAGLRAALKYGKSDIEVFLHSVKDDRPDCSDATIKNIFHHGARVFSIMREEIKRNDLEIGLEINNLLPKTEKSEITIHYMPVQMKGENAMDFTKEAQEKRFNIGYSDKF